MSSICNTQGCQRTLFLHHMHVQALHAFGKEHQSNLDFELCDQNFAACNKLSSACNIRNTQQVIGTVDDNDRILP